MQEAIIRRLRRPASVAGRRVAVSWPGELRFQRLRRPCLVLDLSRAGAHVAVDDVPPDVGEVKLLLEFGPPIAATLAWRRGGRVGLAFRSAQDWITLLQPVRSDAADWVR